jgi:hypothetical protein
MHAFMTKNLEIVDLNTVQYPFKGGLRQKSLDDTITFIKQVNNEILLSVSDRVNLFFDIKEEIESDKKVCPCSKDRKFEAIGLTLSIEDKEVIFGLILRTFVEGGIDLGEEDVERQEKIMENKKAYLNAFFAKDVQKINAIRGEEITLKPIPSPDELIKQVTLINTIEFEKVP